MSANTDNSDILSIHPHTIDLDQALDTNVPWNSPGSFFRLCGGSGWCRTIRHDSRHPIPVK